MKNKKKTIVIISSVIVLIAIVAVLLVVKQNKNNENDLEKKSVHTGVQTYMQAKIVAVDKNAVTAEMCDDYKDVHDVGNRILFKKIDKGQQIKLIIQNDYERDDVSEKNNPDSILVSDLKVGDKIQVPAMQLKEDFTMSEVYLKLVK